MITPDQITQARKDLGRQLAAWRRAAGLTQTQLAARVGYSRSAIGNVETGREQTPRSFWESCERVLNAGGVLVGGNAELIELTRVYREQAARATVGDHASREENIVAADEADGDGEAAVSPVAVGDSMSALHVSGHGGSGRDPVETASVIAVDHEAEAGRWFTVSLVVAGEIHNVRLSRRALLEAASGSLVAPLDSGQQVRVPATIDPAVVEHFAALRALLVDADNRLGGIGVLPTARQQLDVIAEFRRAARGELRDQLLSTQARWAEFVGWLSDDLGDQADGTWWLAQAADMAQEADDTEFVAYLFARRAQRAADGPDQDRVLGLAGVATRTGGPPHVAAFAAVQRAHGHAIAGEERGFRIALDEARQRIDACAAADGALGSFCTGPYLWAQEGDGWLRLHEPKTATDCFGRALTEWPDSYRRERGLCLSRLATAHLAAGEPDEAGRTAMHALRLADMTQSRRIRREVIGVGRRISRFAHRPAVRPLLDALPSARPGSR